MDEKKSDVMAGISLQMKRKQGEFVVDFPLNVNNSVVNQWQKFW